ncbi:MAG: winged helix-turn-helix transcriptional regulator [Patescibacteria group bacterium]
MKTDTREKILEIINNKGQVRAHDLGKSLEISQVAVHKQLKKLINDGLIVKIGEPPHVFYFLKKKAAKSVYIGDLDKSTKKFINSRYIYVTPEGLVLEGIIGFAQWTRSIKQEYVFLRLANRFVQVRKEADRFFDKKTYINATQKFSDTFNKNYLNEVLYQDFYSLPEFGKTKLGSLVLHAKQSQSKKLISDAAEQIFPTIQKLIKEHKINAVGFIPHSIPRKLPFLKYLREKLNLSLPNIDLVKAYAGEIPVAQKSLSKIEERITNARETIFIKDSDISHKRVLLIDDAVGSGATLNETAKKLKENYRVKKVYGYAIVGSYKGFEVIKEV